MSDEPGLKREAALHEDYSAGMVSCVFCPVCAFTYDAAHTITGSYNEYACPVCAELALLAERACLLAIKDAAARAAPFVNPKPGVNSDGESYSDRLEALRAALAALPEDPAENT